MNRSHNFQDDLTFSREIRDTYLVRFYGKYSSDGRYVFVDRSHCSDIIQKHLHVDTIMQRSNGTSTCIEEKAERRFTGNLALETESCTVPGHESEGWMKTGKADLLLYCFPDGTDAVQAYVMDFQELKAWFWTIDWTYREYTMPHNNRTRMRLVPLTDIGNAVGWSRYHITRFDAICTDRRERNVQWAS